MEKNNEQAFPLQRTVTGSGQDYWESPGHLGLSKREYFAGLALQGMMSCLMNMQMQEQLLTKGGPATLCQNAVAMADHLLEQLSKPS